jgi:hypothetical protein
MTTLTNNQNEQLFTDLTAKEAAVIEGGAVFLSHIQALKLTQDEKDGRDEPYILNNRRRIWGPEGMKVGDIRKVGKFVRFGAIQLWEKDSRFDDFIGQLNIDRPRPPLRGSAILTGSGAKYRLFYSILGRR